MRVFGRSFQRTFFAVAVVSLANWSFWLPSGLPAAPAPTATQGKFAALGSTKPAIRLPGSTVAEPEGRISVLADNESTTTVSPNQQRTAGGGALPLPSSSLSTTIPTVKQAGPAVKAKSQASTALGALTPGFIENRGQFDNHVKFALRASGRTVWLTEKGLVFDTLRDESDGSPKEHHLSDSAVNSPVSPGVLPSKGAEVFPNEERLVFNEEFLNANSSLNVEASEPQQGAYNFISGDDPAKWQTRVQAYGEVVYHDVWKDVDMRIYTNGSNLEQEFILRPGGDLSRVQIAYRGINGLSISADGLLEVQTAFGKLQETRPRIYQEIAGNRVEVDGRFKLISETSYTFEVSAHRADYALVIDPTVLYSTFLGGSAGNNYYVGNGEYASGIAVDATGDAYVTGFTASTDFPTTSGVLQPTWSNSGLSDIFITKINSTGSALIYSTYLSGASYARSIAIDPQGNAYVTGYNAWNVFGFPTTATAFSQSCSASGFLTVLNPTGSSLLYSTCFGSSNTPSSLAVDSKGRAFITGTGGTIPTTITAYQTSIPGTQQPAFVTVLDTTLPGAASLVYSTYFGVLGNSSPYGISGDAIAVDSFGNIYITGYAGIGLPTTSGAFQTTYPGVGTCNPYANAQVPCPAAFIAKFNPSAAGTASLIYSTYLGGPGNTVIATAGNGIAVDSAGSAYVTGLTGSSGFPVTPGAFQTTSPAGLQGATYGAFVSKFNASGSSLIYSTYVNGNSPSSGNGIAVDSLGNAYVAGNFRAGGVSNPFFPVTPDAFQSSFTKLSGDYQETFLAKLNAAGSALIYSSYLGGSGDDEPTAVAIDQTGDAYVTGHTSSLDFPVSPSAFQPSVHGTGDAFITKFPLGTSQTLSISSVVPTSGGNAGTVTPQIFGTGFHAGATASFSCGGKSVAGTNLSVGPGGRFLNTTVDLTGVVPGICDVVVTNPDSTSATLSQAFTVQQGGAPNIQIYLTGVAVRQGPPEVALAPSKTAFFATATNIGNADATNVLVVTSLGPEFSLSAVQPPGSDSIPTMTAAGVASWSIPNLGAGQSMVFTYLGTTAAAAFGLPAPIGPAWGLPSPLPPPFPTPLPPPLPVSPTGPSPSLEDMLSCVEGITIGPTDPSNCLAAAQACGIAAAACTEPDYTTNGCSDALAECIVAAAKCALTDKCVPTGKPGSGTTNCVEVSSAPAGGGGSSGCAEVITPSDPNSIVGFPGVGTQGWISGAQALTYGISFGNEPTATAPAQQVVVTVPLSANLSISSVRLPIFTIPNGASDVQVPIPSGSFNPAAGVYEYKTTVDLRPSQALLVGVDVKLDPTTDVLTWTFTSIDPATGSLPLNPLVGFLPAGAGALFTFSAVPMSGLATGAQVAEQATVVFDAQAPMSTATWVNTIDHSSPVSRVISLPATEPLSGFSVNWAGTDVGSGIQDFTIFASDNGGQFAPWLTNTTVTSATFTGQQGHSYAFYSIAEDLVGNIEGSKTSAEATTLVSSTADSIPPVTTATVSPNPNPAGWNNSNVTVTLNATDNAGGSGVKEIHYSMSGAQSGGNVLSGSSTSLIISSEGITTITYFAVDNAGNFEAVKSITSKLDKTPPTILSSRTPVPNANGWNNTPVTVSFLCSDALSGLAAGSPPTPTALSTEGAGQSVNGNCTDLAGNLATAKVPGINIDLTPPVLTATLNPLPNAKGWNKTNVTVTWTAVDSLSGVATVSAPVTVTTEVAGQVITGSATDLAGNLATGSVKVNVDKTPPEAYLQFDPVSRDVVLYGRDSLSGVIPGPVSPISVTPLPGRDDDNHMRDQSHDGDVSQRDDGVHREEIRTYQVFDLAGNSLLLSIEVRKQEQRIDTTVLSVQYNGGSVVALPRNEETFEWDREKVGDLEDLHQTLNVSAGKNSQRWSAKYESRRNSTTIERESPRPEQRSVQPGLVLLQMSTAGGKLSIGF
jgi:hypothetical protein